MGHVISIACHRVPTSRQHGLHDFAGWVATRDEQWPEGDPHIIPFPTSANLQTNVVCDSEDSQATDKRQNSSTMQAVASSSY